MSNIANVSRSLSTATFALNLSLDARMSAAKANGALWKPLAWCEVAFFITLGTLIAKSTNSRNSFGNGNCSGSKFSVPQLWSKGQFWGSNSTTQMMKIFHIEGLWANYWQIVLGVYATPSTVFVKMTPQKEGYSWVLTSQNSDYMFPYIDYSEKLGTKRVCNQFGMFPDTNAPSGSNSTYYCTLTHNGGVYAQKYFGYGAPSLNTGLFFWNLGNPANAFSSNTINFITCEQPSS